VGKDYQMADYFTHKLEEKEPIDVEPIEVVPSWRNNGK
jgi:hypothetical protein